MRNKVFTKENEKKLKEKIRQLRADNRKLLKYIKFLEKELENIIKPIRVRKKKLTPSEKFEDWRKKFLEDFRKGRTE